MGNHFFNIAFWQLSQFVRNREIRFTMDKQRRPFLTLSVSKKGALLLEEFCWPRSAMAEGNLGGRVECPSYRCFNNSTAANLRQASLSCTCISVRWLVIVTSQTRRLCLLCLEWNRKTYEVKRILRSSHTARGIFILNTADSLLRYLS